MKNPDEETRKSLREYFGISSSPPRKPIPSRTFNTLVKIYSLLPDQSQNPLSQYANCPDYSHVPGWVDFDDVEVKESEEQTKGEDAVHDEFVPTKINEAAELLVSPARGEFQDLPFENETTRGRTSGILCRDSALSGSDMIVDKLDRPSSTEEMGDIASDEVAVDVGTTALCDVQDNLIGIQKILMEESDDFGMVQETDKYMNLLANDLGSVLEEDTFGSNSVTVVEKIGKDEEVHRPTSEGEMVSSQAQPFVNRDTSSNRGLLNQNVNTCPKDAQIEDKMFCKKKVPGKSSKIEVLPSTIQNNLNVGGVPTGDTADSLEMANQFGAVADGKGKKAVKAKKTPVKERKPRKHKPISVDGEGCSSTKSRGNEPVLPGATLKQNASEIVKEEEKRLLERSVGLRYTREQLLNLRKVTFVPDDIVKAVRDIAAEIYVKDRVPAASKHMSQDILSNKEHQSLSADDEKTEEKGSSTLKQRGSGSEARKKKRKLKKKKKRAELNEKLGVKRLKLTPIMKPKVVQPCRHYLNGRCHEGEKCKFSHDVVPLTKSKPCCHFARQGCMKGDDCPFDHQLSKYPCNNYVTTGFCSRGDSCLFSHKAPAKEVSEPAIATSKYDTMVKQRDLPKSSQQLDPSVSFPSGMATPKNLKENLAIQTRAPANAPKGLSFFSFGGSHAEDSAKRKESELSQSDGTAGANVQPDMVVGAASKLRKTVMDSHAFGTPQGTGNWAFERRSGDSSGDRKQPSPQPSRDSSSHHSLGKSLLNESAKIQLDNTSRTSGHAVSVGNQLNQGSFSGGLKLSEIVKGATAPATSKGIRITSSDGLLHDKSGSFSGGVFSTNKPDSPLGLREKGSASVPHKSMGLLSELGRSQTSPVQFSTKADLTAKSTPNNAQRALLSTLSFASKFESGIKLSSVSKQSNQNEGSTSRGDSRPKEPSQAPSILQFLYSGTNKEKK